MSAIALLCGLALSLAFPRVGLAPLAWIAPVPWLMSLQRASPRKGLLTGWIFGLGYFGLLLGWVHGVLVRYTSLPVFLSVPIWCLLVGYLALYPALFGAAQAALARRLGTSALLLAPAIWIGAEAARARVLGGFPWGRVGYARAGGLPLMQAASVGGVSLVGALIVAIWAASAYTALALQRRRGGGGAEGSSVRARGERAGRLGPAVAAGTFLLVGLVVVAGWARLRARPIEGEALVLWTGSAGSAERGGFGGSQGSFAGQDGFSLLLIQGGFGPDLDADGAARALQAYLALSRSPASAEADLIVWPESNAPFLLLETPEFLGALERIARGTGTPVLLGSVGGDLDAGLTNSAFLVGEEGVRDRYDKQRLVQYGEYVPLKRVFPFIRHFVPQAGEFRPGNRVGTMRVGERRIGVSICYEIIFPRVILDQARDGADLVVNITNDSWYEAGGPWQHADFAALRAIETGLHTVRVASTGISLAVDPLGRRLVTGPLGGAAVIGVRVPRGGERGGGGRTPLVRWGDWADPLCATISLVALAAVAVGNIMDRRRRQAPIAPPGPRTGR